MLKALQLIALLLLCSAALGYDGTSPHGPREGATFPAADVATPTEPGLHSQVVCSCPVWSECCVTTWWSVEPPTPPDGLEPDEAEGQVPKGGEMRAPQTGGDPPEEPRPASSLTLVYSDPANDAHVEVTGTLSGGAFVDVYAHGAGPDGIGKPVPCRGREDSLCSWAISEAFWAAYPFQHGPAVVDLYTADGAVKLRCYRETVGNYAGVVQDCQTAGQVSPGETCGGAFGADLSGCVAAASGARGGGWVGAEARDPRGLPQIQSPTPTLAPDDETPAEGDDFDPIWPPRLPPRPLPTAR